MNQWRETTLLTGAMESQDGIQRLLAAEQEAQAIVNAARQGTTFVFSLTRPPHRRPVAPKRRADSSNRPNRRNHDREDGEAEAGQGGGGRGGRGLQSTEGGGVPGKTLAGARADPTELRPDPGCPKSANRGKLTSLS